MKGKTENDCCNQKQAAANTQGRKPGEVRGLGMDPQKGTNENKAQGVFRVPCCCFLMFVWAALLTPLLPLQKNFKRSTPRGRSSRDSLEGSDRTDLGLGVWVRVLWVRVRVLWVRATFRVVLGHLPFWTCVVFD